MWVVSLNCVHSGSTTCSTHRLLSTSSTAMTSRNYMKPRTSWRDCYRSANCVTRRFSSSQTNRWRHLHSMHVLAACQQEVVFIAGSASVRDDRAHFGAVQSLQTLLQSKLAHSGVWRAQRCRSERKSRVVIPPACCGCANRHLVNHLFNFILVINLFENRT